MRKEPGSSVRDRAAYIPIHKRPRLRLPGDARVAVWTIVNVENWSPLGADAAHRAAAADGAAAAARRAELGLARVRHARRLLALPGGAGQRASSRRPLPLTARPVEPLPRGLPGGARRRLGLHGPRLRPEADAPGRRPARRHRRHHRGDQGLHRQAAARLGEPRPHRDRRDARPAGRGRHRICRRLGARRAAGAAQDARRRRSSRCPTRSRSTTS